MIVTQEVLEQLAEQLGRLTPEQYSQRLAVFNGSSIGSHTRHVLEFYQCLQAAVDTGCVNYDARERNMLLEQHLGYALTVIESCIYQSASLGAEHKELMLHADFGADNQVVVPTNFAREAVYLAEHSIHHFALIRIGIQENFQSVEIVPGFGLAYSTLAHRNKKQQPEMAHAH